MTAIQFGFCMPAELRTPERPDTFGADLDRALTLITGHFDSAWFIDHLQDGEHAMLEGFTALAYMAARHPRLLFGHTVLCQSFRNPALLAKMGATLQFLSGGRFILGLGAGWHEEEYRAYGYDFPPAGVRVEQLEETVQIIRALWTQPRATFAGRHYHITNAVCEPRPDPVPPLMIGAFKPKMLRLAARYADEWNVSSTSITHYRPLAAAFDRACAEVGRDPATVRRSWGGGCACAPTAEQAAALTGGRYNADPAAEDFDFAGTPAQIVALMRPFIDLGVDRFILDCGGFPDLTTLELLVTEVQPAVNR
jgi:alkanesulfonate monooxygenase SsuD/methylene tetrahydromethanopterin reductase-like flavin-dependent oxidoreductase (luciferase family)